LILKYYSEIANRDAFFLLLQNNPGCNYNESKYVDQYSKLVIESMMDDDADKQDKIIRNIAKEVVIDKKDYM
jgi:hypothetical protein